MVVVGSGPAGVSCATALLAAGARVVMVDGGQDLDPERRGRLEALQSVQAADWDAPSVSFVRDGAAVSTRGIPLKRAYGSSYPYDDPLGQPVELLGADTKASWARGGLSSVWGAAVLPYRDEDLSGWPIGVVDLEPHYRAVLQTLPVSGRQDHLAELLPLYTDRLDPLPTSAQASQLLDDLERRGEQARRRGLWSGASRLAVRASDAPAGAGCVRCGLCLYGCPHELIYNSAHALASLVGHPAFTYRPGLVVERLEERGGGVLVSGTSVPSGEAVHLRGDKAFVGAGVLGSARLLLTSLDAYEQPVTMRDSCYYLLPLVRYESAPGASTEARHTLAQAFIEVIDPTVSPYTVHLQIYTYNELFRAAVRGLLGPADRVVGRPVDRSLLSRILLVQGYLHSEHSPTVTVVLRRSAGSAHAVLELTANDEPATRRVLRALLRKLRAERSLLRALPADPLLRVGKPGRGFHSGGTFPMRERPTAIETDTLGRPGGTGNVHVIDSSVFPTIPATTITLTVMANAHRIATQAMAS